ncbi:rab11 family-interacting protein 4A-like isoform 1-T1 [Salvelinus alpinus]
MESVLPDAEQLLLFLRKLKEVFELCDEDSDGYIRVEHFVDLGSQFGQGDEVKKLAKCLDPNAQGRINFKDFCHGVLAIKGHLSGHQPTRTHEWGTSQPGHMSVDTSQTGHMSGHQPTRTHEWGTSQPGHMSGKLAPPGHMSGAPANQDT